MDDPHPDIIWLTRPDGLRLATLHDPGRHDPGRHEHGKPAARPRPGILFLHGLMSDMEGEKAEHLARHARKQGLEYLRLDLSGHGHSEGAFEDGTISQWRDDALLALDHGIAGPVLLVGSSIGGWIALLAALARPERIVGMLLIAPAPDMTERVLETLPDEAWSALRTKGVWMRPSIYGPPIPITQRMLDDGNRLCLLDKPIPIACPVRILHGQKDPDVPWEGSLKLADRLESSDVQTILLKQGGHRLSTPHELALTTGILDRLLETLDAG